MFVGSIQLLGVSCVHLLAVIMQVPIVTVEVTSFVDNICAEHGSEVVAEGRGQIQCFFWGSSRIPLSATCALIFSLKFDIKQYKSAFLSLGIVFAFLFH